MPKSSGQSLKVTRAPPRPQPSREIKRFEQRAPGPHHNPPAATPPTPSNELAAEAVRIASDHDRSIDPRQMRR
jgi:hypothetical protein